MQSRTSFAVLKERELIPHKEGSLEAPIRHPLDWRPIVTQTVNAVNRTKPVRAVEAPLAHPLTLLRKAYEI